MHAGWVGVAGRVQARSTYEGVCMHLAICDLIERDARGPVGAVDLHVCMHGCICVYTCDPRAPVGAVDLHVCMHGCICVYACDPRAPVGAVDPYACMHVWMDTNLDCPREAAATISLGDLDGHKLHPGDVKGSDEIGHLGGRGERQ